jgi:chloramphenicol-sensitive protein RarD
VWSLVFLAIVMGVRGQTQWLRTLREQWRTVLLYFLAATFLACNWGLYIWGVNAGFVVETSLGYFINPLINVVFGAFLLGERLRRVQWLAVAIAAGGVLYLTVDYGQPPWLALALAVTFAIYGLIKKKAPMGALEGLSLETALLFPPALIFLGACHLRGVGALGHVGALENALLLGAGVATAVPLLCFAAAVRRLTLITIGILQYMAPTIQFLLGVFVYEEPFSLTRLVGFCMIWGALILYTGEGVVWRRRLTRSSS